MNRRRDVHRVLGLVANDQPLTPEDSELLNTITVDDIDRSREDSALALRAYREIITDATLAQMILDRYPATSGTRTLGEAMAVMTPEDARDVEVLMQDVMANQRATHVMFGTDWTAPV